MTNQSPVTEYITLDTAFAHFNHYLFGCTLPPVIITLQRKNHAYGYFSGDRFYGRDNDERTHEIALNPELFNGRTDTEILATLAHEMAHLWQYVHGKRPRRAYHDKQWANKMLEIGLQPINVDHPDKMTGQKVTHEIMDGGAFAQCVADFLAQGYALRWQSASLDEPKEGEEKEKKERKKSKVKYTCPGCEQNAWAKPGANLFCGDCMISMKSEETEEEAGEEEEDN